MLDEAELERMIAELLRRKYAAPEASAERRMAQRQLLGLRYSYELAGPIMEDLDPLEWGAIDVAPAENHGHAPLSPFRTRF